MGLKKLSRRHHLIALLAAADKTPEEIAHLLCFHPKSICRLLHEPLIKGLMATHRQDIKTQGSTDLSQHFNVLTAQLVDHVRAVLASDPDGG